MKKKIFSKSKRQGFTLIELLVVISIIALLSTVVLASLSNARAKARDAAIKSEVLQYRTLLEQEYSDTGSYAGLQLVQWATLNGTPGTGFNCDMDWLNHSTSKYADQALSICKAIGKNGGAALGRDLFVGNVSDNANKYSIMAYLPSKGTYYCIGSSGAVSDTQPFPIPGNPWPAPGCYDNP